MSLRQKFGFIAIIIICMVAIVSMFLLGPIAQDPVYHLFADQRKLLSLPNFADVTSNVFFLVIGLLGLKQLFKGQLNIVDEFKHAYLFLFLGIALTAFGSAYYHISPNNQTLFWDRLPIAIAMMSLISIILAEFVCLKFAKLVFWPALMLGALSVIYWIWTENTGHGDLRFYGLVQFLPMASIPIILICFKSRFSHVHAYWWLLLCYAAAKVFEHFDKETFLALGIISGHTLKHLIAALGLWLLLKSFQNRKSGDQ